MGVLIKNGTVVNAGGRTQADVLCQDGKIAAVGMNLEKASAKDEVIDASGQYVLPGGVDPHVHLALPFMGTVSADDFESGTAAALAGGTTTLIDLVIPGRERSLLEGLKEWHAKAKNAVADYSWHMSVNGWNDRTADEMRIVVEDEGISSFKLFMAYKGAIMVDDDELYRMMKRAGELGAVVTVHAEHGDSVFHRQKELIAAGHTEPKYHAISRPSSVEGEATGRALMIGRLTGATVYIVHMSAREALEALARAKAEGQKCYGETCPQYLLLDDSVYEKPDFEGATYVMSPPIRPRAGGHQDAMWAHVQDGILSTIGTDHCPFTMEQKRMGLADFTKIPNGAPGVEERLAILYTQGVLTGRISLERMVELCAAEPARIFGLNGRKGIVAAGADADVVVWNPEGERTISAKTHHSRCDRSMFEGLKVTGGPSYVVAAGRVQYANGDLKVERGAGKFLRRTAGAPADPAALVGAGNAGRRG
jgi:dihydropyrimidinase